MQPGAPYMQNRVQYYSGKTIFSGSGIGLLEWSSDGHIHLFDVDITSGQSKGVIFDCLPNQIEKVSATLSSLTIHLGGKRFSMDLSNGNYMLLGAGGLLGIFMASQVTKKSGIQWWVDNLQSQGVTVKKLKIL
jgi:hypothetical protein